MAEMDLAAVMDELARRVEDAVPALEGRCYGWPNPVLSPPAFAVSFPPTIDLAAAYRQGVQRARFPCDVVFGIPGERVARDAVSGFVQDVRAALDGSAEGIWSSAMALELSIGVTLNDDGSAFLAGRFTVDVAT